MRYDLEDRDPAWSKRAPVTVVHRVAVPAPPAIAWEVLADQERWPDWYVGVSEVALLHGDGRVGTRRRVRAGFVTVEEEVRVFEPPVRIGLTVVSSSVPGLRAMTEEWELVPDHTGQCELVLRVGGEGRGPIRLVPRLLRAVLTRSTAGAVGFSRASSHPS